MLYDECETFCKLASDRKTTLAKINEAGHRIVTKFIVDDAPFAVNLPDGLKQDAILCDKIREYSVDTFERLRVLMFNELKLNFHHAFVKLLNHKFVCLLGGENENQDE